MGRLIEAIEIKRKTFFEYEDAPFVCLDAEVSKPTARGGQTLVRLKMRNLISRAVFDKTFKAAEKFAEPDLVVTPAAFSYGAGDEYHFIDQDSYDDLTLTADQLGDDRLLLADNLLIQVQKFNGRPIGVQFPPHVELTVADTEPGVRGDTASGGVTKGATLETGLEIRVPRFIKVGEKVKVHTETREFAVRARRPRYCCCCAGATSTDRLVCHDAVSTAGSAAGASAAGGRPQPTPRACWPHRP
jgi:elongation factor P